LENANAPHSVARNSHDYVGSELELELELLLTKGLATGHDHA
jgi:hypothetical protein